MSVTWLPVPGTIRAREWQDPTSADLDAIEDDWRNLALCPQTDPEIFFPEKGGSTREAKKVCRACEVRAECLDYALENREPWGIWGGLSDQERRQLLREGQAA